MTEPTEADRIAEGLTEADRFAIRELRILHFSGRRRDTFVKAGILMPGGTNWTPLGLAVRAILQEQEQ